MHQQEIPVVDLSKAQEEDLACCSGLYPCLLTQPDYYDVNKLTEFTHSIVNQHSEYYLYKVTPLEVGSVIYPED